MANRSNKLGVPPIGFIAGAAIAINTAVKLGANPNEVVPATAITDVVIGIAEQAAAQGDTVPVQLFGVAKAVLGAGGAALNAQLMPLAAGAGVLVTAAGATARSVGIALEAGNAGETIPVLLCTPNLNGPPNA